MAKARHAETPARKHKHPVLRRVATIAGVLVLVTALAPFVVVWIGQAGRISSVDDVETHDVAIVFGAAMWGAHPSPYLESRLQVALELYQAGKVKVILVSGDNREDNYNEPGGMKAWLVDQGVPEDKIVTDGEGLDTYATCTRAKDVFGLDSAILVSQTYHLHRAVTTCRLIGLDAVGVGDETRKSTDPAKWFQYSLREIPADYKMILDVFFGARVLGDRDLRVDEALAR
ncbi:MAG: YdcF family protein [Propionibacteriaceae bacterium]|jgi:vancomycin permeability regulator SanA|nr:YdcF family protein [Propionibacteriaceae bacterium]